jgi:hypothetical protein
MPGREAVEAKFRWAASDALTAGQIDGVLSSVRGLSDLPNVRALARSLVVTPAAVI